MHDGGRGEWLALPGLLAGHPDWFVRLTPEGRPPPARSSTTPARTRAYLGGVRPGIVEEHGADGIELDGLGDVEGQLIPFAERAGLPPPALGA